MLTLLPTGPVPYRHTKHQSCKYSLRILTTFTKVIILSSTYGTNLQQSSPTLNQIYNAESIDRDILMGDHIRKMVKTYIGQIGLYRFGRSRGSPLLYSIS